MFPKKFLSFPSQVTAPPRSGIVINEIEVKHMKTWNILLASTLALGILSGCESEAPQNTESEGASQSTPAENTPDVTLPEENLSFTIPEHYAHLDETIAKVFCSIQNMPGYRYIPNMPLDGEMLAEMYGITSDLYENYYGEVPMMSQQADMLLLFQTQDTDTLAETLDALLERERSNLSQYPSTLSKLAAAEVGVFGDYVYLNMLSSYPENEAELDEAAMNAYYADTTALISEEIQRVLEGGAPHVAEISTEPETEERSEGEILPEASTFPNQTEELPEVGESTGGHAPENIPSVDIGGGSAR